MPKKREKWGADRGRKQLDFGEAYMDRLDDARDSRLARTKRMLAKRRGVLEEQEKEMALLRFAERQAMGNARSELLKDIPLPLSNPEIGQMTDKQKIKMATCLQLP